MRLDWKTIILGGLVFYVVQFIVSMLTAPLIHEGVLEPHYMANQQFWRPELNQDPPDMAALMPRWITVGVLMSLLFAGIYDNIRDAFSGSAAVKGVKFGVVLALIFSAAMAGWSGVFNLPNVIWVWWAVESFAYFIVGGAALGWFVGRFGSR